VKYWIHTGNQILLIISLIITLIKTTHI
jgi:hypothetical protein